MKTLIVYKTKTGFTERYANWLKEETLFDCVSIKKVTKEMLSSFDTVIFGGGIYAGQISGLKKIKQLIGGKTKLIVFATGATPAEDIKQLDATFKFNFTEEEIKSIPHFYFPTGLDYDRMSFGNRILMKLFSKMLDSKQQENPDDKTPKQSLANSFDISDKKYINPLLDYLKVR